MFVEYFTAKVRAPINLQFYAIFAEFGAFGDHLQHPCHYNHFYKAEV